MDTYLTNNVVVFELVGTSQVRGGAPAIAEDCVRRAWDTARVEHRACAEDVVALRSEWEPSVADSLFISRTFPNAAVYYTFPRPDPDRWAQAFEATRVQGRMSEVERDGELLPMLWSASSPQVDLLGMMPHRALVPGRLFVSLAMIGVGRGGSVGVSHLTHRRLGAADFGELYREACLTLRGGLRVDGYDDGVVVVHREGSLAVAAVCLPDFHAEMSRLVGEERFVVGMACPQTLVVAAVSSPHVARVRSLVLGSDYPSAELIPSVLEVDRRGISVVVERL